MMNSRIFSPKKLAKRAHAQKFDQHIRRALDVAAARKLSLKSFAHLVA
jgi:hypothetical protein